MATENRDRPARAPESGPDPLGDSDEVLRKVGILVSRFRFPEQI